jgi:hypothetical protein
MSLGSKHLARAYEAGRAKIVQQNEDRRRGEFLRALDASQESLTEFEERFVADFMQKYGDQDHALDWRFFTDGRRRVVDNLMKRYQPGSLKLTTSAASRPIPQAEPGCCGYLTRTQEARNVPCNAKAVIKLNNGLELCQEHDDLRKQGLEKLRAAKTRNMR